MKTFKFTILIPAVLFSCVERSGGRFSGQWIKGTEEERLQTIESQFRGFDVAMVETGYRYQELYWAGKDENWEYAEYQLDKIRVAISSGLERRPKRAESAQPFLNEALPEMKKALEKKDTAVFLRGIQALTNQCNACHARENFPFFTVQFPVHRQSPIRNP